MWFLIALKDIETGKATIPKGTLLRVTQYSQKQIKAEAIGLDTPRGEKARVIMHQPAWWLEHVGLSANTFS